MVADKMCLLKQYCQIWPELLVTKCHCQSAKLYLCSFHVNRPVLPDSISLLCTTVEGLDLAHHPGTNNTLESNIIREN